MKLIKAVLRPEKAIEAKDQLQSMGFHGISTWRVNGYGEIKKTGKRVYRGKIYLQRMDNVERTALELVVSDEKAEKIIETIRNIGCTGNGGDGRIYTFPLDDSIHVDTGSRHLGGVSEDGAEDV